MNIFTYSFSYVLLQNWHIELYLYLPYFHNVTQLKIYKTFFSLLFKGVTFRNVNLHCPKMREDMWRHILRSYHVTSILFITFIISLKRFGIVSILKFRPNVWYGNRCIHMIYSIFIFNILFLLDNRRVIIMIHTVFKISEKSR